VGLLVGLHLDGHWRVLERLQVDQVDDLRIAVLDLRRDREGVWLFRNDAELNKINTL